MLKIVVLSMGFLMASAQAQDCQPVKLQFISDADTVKACQTLGYDKLGQIQACDKKVPVLTNSRGALYDLESTEVGWKHMTVNVDTEANQVHITSIELDLNRSRFAAHEVFTDSRGHLRQKISCSGQLKAH